MSRNPRTLALLQLSTACLLAALALQAPLRVAAQTCDEEDAGDEDGGSDDDGGLACEPASGDSGVPSDGADASLPDAGAFADAGDHNGAVCSCETDENTGGGPIHVCTGARERDVCRQFECESSIVRDRACPTSGVALCCEMPVRGLYSQLYEDCTHPNCEAGFRAQCVDFGGSVSKGACVVEDADGASGGSGGGCSVPGRGRTSDPSTALLCMLGIALAVRIQRRTRGAHALARAASAATACRS